MKKISVCTVCMNRLAYLRQTLPLNITDNMDYPEMEFILLDYNSTDGLEDWVRAEMMPFIEAGVLKYYKNPEPAYFDLSHSKNMALKLGSGEVLCMVDADNFAGKGYIRWVDAVFGAEGKDTVITTLRKEGVPYRDQGGKLCFSRELLYSVNGFDESLIGYGMEDIDLVERLEKKGGSRYFIDDGYFLECIGHSTEERVKNFHMINNLEEIYLCNMEWPVCVRVLYLLSDSTFLEVIFNYDAVGEGEWIKTFGGWTMREGSQRKGYFENREGIKILRYEGGPVLTYHEEVNGAGRSFTGPDGLSWVEIPKGDALYCHVIKGYSECINRIKFLQNQQSSEPINQKGWGRGRVYRDFNKDIVFEIV